MAPIRSLVVVVASLLLSSACKPRTSSDAPSGAASAPSGSDAALGAPAASAPVAAPDSLAKSALERILRDALPMGAPPSESELRKKFADIRSKARPEEQPLVDRAEKLAGALAKAMEASSGP